MSTNKIRFLKSNEIEIRVVQILKNGYQLVLYKNSRCDKRILDEVYGPLRWKSEYSEIKGNLYCTISVWDEEIKQWISKQDCGTESNMEKAKGEATDAFKRAGTAWGIGRELYTKLFIWVQGGTQPLCDNSGKQIVKNSKPQYELINKYMQWHVSKIEVDEEIEKIIGLEIEDDSGIVVFSFGTVSVNNKKEDPPVASDFQWELDNIDMATPEQMKQIHAGCEFTGISEKALLKRTGVKKWEYATYAQAQHALNYLNTKADMKNEQSE